MFIISVHYNKNKYNTCGISNLKNVFMILISIAIGNMLAKHFRIEHEFLIISLIYSTLIINHVFLLLLWCVKGYFESYNRLSWRYQTSM